MKKSKTFLAMLALSALLVGCSDEKEKGTEKHLAETITTSEDEKLSMNDFLKKINDKTYEIKSFASDTTILITTVTDGKEEKMPLNISMKATMNPLRVKQYIDMDLRENGLGRIKSLLYLEDGYMYLQHPENGSWMKTEVEEFDSIMKETLKQSPTELMNWVKEHHDLFSLDKKEAHYVFTFKGKQTEIEALLDEQLISLVGGNKLPITPAKEQFDYEAITYEITVDEKTFTPVSFAIKTNFTATVNEKKLSSQLELTTVYREINAVEPLDLPEEAKNAKNVSE